MNPTGFLVDTVMAGGLTCTATYLISLSVDRLDRYPVLGVVFGMLGLLVLTLAVGVATVRPT
ncbi:hypothetical protein [Glycomyces xiaoerkulensis]|uniref:hypothetical protein n=1 Tax=Glycomyces xiaoerkulensis TaxID=2038139 RepID=UPI000C260A10|nr:hypothetical protein [Glycomyces xiaoerkulensis]